MWKYLPTGETFSSRLEAKMKLGHGFANRAIRYRELILINDTALAYDEYTISTNPEETIRA